MIHASGVEPSDPFLPLFFHGLLCQHVASTSLRLLQHSRGQHIDILGPVSFVYTDMNEV